MKFIEIQIFISGFLKRELLTFIEENAGVEHANFIRSKVDLLREYEDGEEMFVPEIGALLKPFLFDAMTSCGKDFICPSIINDNAIGCVASVKEKKHCSGNTPGY